MATLVEKMAELFEQNEEISGLMNTGQLPLDLPDIAAIAMSEHSELPAEIDFPDEEYLAVGMAIAERFWPNNPTMGFEKAMQGGPVPHSMLMIEIGSQVQSEYIRRKQ